MSELQTALLHWFAANGRDLPWRRTRDPYQILVSETMLQQTQVDRVIPKYHAFLAAFPTVAALAEAPTAEVIKLWAGLGYNRRAVNLQRAAQMIHNELDGRFPQSVSELLRLPGVGPYTAGAVACFAFEQPVGFIDTNIRRVVRRLRWGESEQSASEQALIDAAEQLVPTDQAWAWNQAIMELGALVCVAATPQCWRCPLRSHCRAYAQRLNADAEVFSAYSAPVAPVARRRVAEKPSEQFVGSRRYYRGRVVAALRELPLGGHLSLAELGPLVKADYGPADAAWLTELVADLARDGLAIRDEAGVRLP